jgi:hypothetical protein
MVLIVTINAHSYIDAHSYMEDRITDACAHRRRAYVLLSCARACGCGFGRTRIRAEPCEPFPSAWTACGFGAQAFSSASAFNANIGAWNTARVTSLAYVCAASGPAARHRRRPGRARPGLDAARPVVRGGSADARARARARAGTRLCEAMGIAMAARRRDSTYVRFVIYIHLSYICMYILEPVGFVYACITVRADGSAVCAHAVVGLCGRYGSALHMLSSAPGAPSMSLPDLYIATCVYL